MARTGSAVKASTVTTPKPVTVAPPAINTGTTTVIKADGSTVQYAGNTSATGISNVTGLAVNPVAAAVPVATVAAAPVTMAVVPNTVTTATPTPSAPIKTVVQQPLTVATPIAVVVPPPALTLVADTGVAAGATVSTSTLAHPNQGQNPNQTNLIASVSAGWQSGGYELTSSEDAGITKLGNEIQASPDAVKYILATASPSTTLQQSESILAQASQIAGIPASDLAAAGITVNANYAAHTDPYDDQPGNTTYPMVPDQPPILTISPGTVVVPSSPITDGSSGISLNGPPIDSNSLNGGTTSNTVTDNSKAILGLLALFVIYMVVKRA